MRYPRGILPALLKSITESIKILFGILSSLQFFVNTFNAKRPESSILRGKKPESIKNKETSHVIYSVTPLIATIRNVEKKY